MLPKLPKPGLPQPPRISELLKGNPLHEAIGDARSLLRQGTDDIRGIASSLRGDTETKPVEQARAKTDKIAEGTACNLCSSEHFNQVSGDLAEAMRFARSDGVKHPEVIRRITHARDELNEMERYDLSPAELEKLSGPERQLAEWALPKSRNIRHMINQAITTKSVDDLQKAAAEVQTIATEFLSRVMQIPSERAIEECYRCGELEDLKTFIERRRAQTKSSGEQRR